MVKSFVMAVWNVAQTWYSSLRPGTITSWQKLKDMLVTSFQGFQMKPVTAQTLFQCTQDHEGYLQAYVRRFLRLRAQAPTVPNEIVIEAMIKGLRPGPTAQYFARKPHRPWRSYFRKWMSTFELITTFAKEGRKRTDSLGWPGASEDESTRGMSGWFIAPVRTTTKGSSLRGHSTPHNLRPNSKALSGHQLQGAEAPGASEEDLGISPGRSTVYSVARTRSILQECAKSPSKSRRRSQKPKLGRVSQSRSCTLLRATLPTYQNTWVIILQLLWLQLVSHTLPGHSLHLHHHFNLPIHGANSQKGANTLNSNENLGRNPKLAQSIVLCRSQSTFTERYPASEILFRSLSFCFLIMNK
jgi:hypothetical protein